MAVTFDLEKFLIDVFDPQPGERAAVLVDVPTTTVSDHAEWKARREMAVEWRDGLGGLGASRGFIVLPLVRYAATGTQGGDLPDEVEVGDERRGTAALFDEISLALVMSEFSATGALVDVCKRRPGADVFRAASMPGIQKRMEQTSLAADYAQVATHCRLLRAILEPAELAEIEFSTGHRCVFDLRHRVCETDDGYLHQDKTGDIAAINLPSGETFQVPYEGEIEGDPSRTEGELPVGEDGETVVFRVRENRIVEVEGDGAVAKSYTEFFEADPARRNVAEIAFGCNDRAEVTGNVLEDEKAGFHWAYGRSDHLGGVVGLDRFMSADTVVHQDIVYARGNPITITTADLIAPDGGRTTVIKNGDYILW
ncbi:MAG: aminopeptidase [Acidobacteriota bacterium]|nr:aminopeptidase [Acidobacteriota bacterium]